MLVGAEERRTKCTLIAAKKTLFCAYNSQVPTPPSPPLLIVTTRVVQPTELLSSRCLFEHLYPPTCFRDGWMDNSRMFLSSQPHCGLLKRNVTITKNVEFFRGPFRVFSVVFPLPTAVPRTSSSVWQRDLSPFLKTVQRSRLPGANNTDENRVSRSKGL